LEIGTHEAWLNVMRHQVVLMPEISVCAKNKPHAISGASNPLSETERGLAQHQNQQKILNQRCVST